MKKVIISLIAILMLSGLSAELRIVKSKSAKDISLKALGKDLKHYDVIFFGEFHDNASIHKLQRELLPYLVDGSRKLVLSFEMWERDTQELLDAFLADKIDEQSFIEGSRAWSNYQDSYRPLILFAKEHRLAVVAANVPREYAGRSSRSGWDFVEDLPSEERALIAAQLTAPDDAYREAFIQTMQGMGSHAFEAESLERFYQAQCMKDDTMAESIVIALDYYKAARVIHFNGAFHSQNGLGTVSRLQKALPQLKIAIINPIMHEDWQSLKVDKSMRASGTHLLLMDTAAAEEEE